MAIKQTKQIITDVDPIPFGKHQGTPMQDVPVEYFHFLWHNGMKGENSPVAEYIRRNLDVLKTENEDLIWS